MRPQVSSGNVAGLLGKPLLDCAAGSECAANSVTNLKASVISCSLMADETAPTFIPIY